MSAEEMVTDADGNKHTRPSATGVVCRAVVQPVTIVGANAEGLKVGFETESTYRMRLIGYPNVLGAQAQVEWNGKRYVIDGDARVYNGSPRTRHVDYAIKRY